MRCPQANGLTHTRSSLCWEVLFHKSYSQGSARFHRQDPGPMFQLVGHVEIRVVAGVGLPHLPKDFQPALAQAPQGGGVTFSLGPELLVIDFSPRAARAARVGPQVNGVPK